MATQAQDDWFLTFFGVDVAKFAGPASATAGRAAPGKAATQTPSVAGKAPPADPSSWVLQTIVIEPDHPSVPAGEQLQFDAQGLYVDSHFQQETDALVWGSSDPKTVSFDGAGKKGLATVHKQGEVTITATEPNSGKVGTTTLKAMPPQVSEMSAADLDKGEAYRLGLADGRFGDPAHRAGIQDSDLLASYNEGFNDGTAASDTAWDDVGKAIDSAPSAKQPTKEGQSTDDVLTEVGIVATLLSVVEAGGSVAAAGVGTTLGVIILPILAFRLGTAIAQKQDDYEAAIKLFIDKFIAMTLFDSMERARTMVKSTGGPVKEVNDDGVTASKAIYSEMRSQLSSKLTKYLDRKATAEEFAAVHNTWVKNASKKYANVLSNPRFRK